MPRCLFTLVHVVLFLCFGPFFYEVSSSFVRCECVPFVYFPPFVEVFLKCVGRCALATLDTASEQDSDNRENLTNLLSNVRLVIIPYKPLNCGDDDVLCWC